MPAPPPRSPRPLVILGPTAGGKSGLAVTLAEMLPERGEVIGADSMQVYRHLDAGTAKPTPAMRAAAPHHLIDVVEPTQRFTVSDWLALADEAIAGVQARGRRPIIVGGTNLYLKALLEGLFDAPPADPAFRAELDAVEDVRQLHRRLAEVDTAAAERIDPNDRRRITRALEVHRHTGRPISAMQTQWSDDPSDAGYRHDPVLLGLRWPVEQINSRINLRVKAMFFPDSVQPELAAEVCPHGESLPDEVRRLVDRGLIGTDATPQASEAIGYKQCLAALRGQMSWDDAFEKTKIATRRLGKAQRTWLKRFRGVTWIDMPADDAPARALTALA